MAIGFQTGAFQSNAFQQTAAGPPPPQVSIWNISNIYIRDNWRTVFQSLKFPFVFLFTFWT